MPLVYNGTLANSSILLVNTWGFVASDMHETLSPLSIASAYLQKFWQASSLL